MQNNGGDEFEHAGHKEPEMPQQRQSPPPAQNRWGNAPGYSASQSSHPVQPGYPQHSAHVTEEHSTETAALNPDLENFEDPAQAGTEAQPEQKRRGLGGIGIGPLVLLVVAVVVISAGTTLIVNGTQENTTVTNTLDDVADGSATSRLPEDGSTAEVAQRVTPSVVQIQVQTSRGGEEGSGSIFTNDGMILTNNHVVGAAANGQGKIQVVLNDGRVLPAKFVAADAQTDIAVIKAEGATDLQSIAMGDSDAINVGEDVVAIGSPLGLNSTVTSGIVSAKNRPVQATGDSGGEASLIDAIQTDAAINPGNSGGALVNLSGELVGIPTVIATMGGQESSGSIGLGFAIPSNQAARIAKQLIEDGEVKHPMIGAQINTMSQVIGAEVVSVNEDSPADEAGLEEGDVVVKVDDRVIDSGVGLIAAIRSHEFGDTVTLTVIPGGDGEEEELEVTLNDAS